MIFPFALHSNKVGVGDGVSIESVIVGVGSSVVKLSLSFCTFKYKNIAPPPIALTNKNRRAYFRYVNHFMRLTIPDREGKRKRDSTCTAVTKGHVSTCYEKI